MVKAGWAPGPGFYYFLVEDARRPIIKVPTQ